MIFWVLVILLLGLIYWKLKKSYQYFTNIGVKQFSKQVIFLGDNYDIVFGKKSIAEYIQHIYNKFPNERYFGSYSFQIKALVIRDPELLKRILVKDFDHFTDRQSFMPDEYVDPLWSKNLFALKGEKWREMRATLSPAFTSSKMKLMFSLMSDCAEQFTNHLINHPEDESELKDLFTRFSNDVIATCAFGVKCDSLKERDNEFFKMGLESTDLTGFWSFLKFLLFIAVPSFCKLIGLTFFSARVGSFFKTLVVDTVKMREANNIIRPDMIHLLMQARKGQLKYEEEQSSKEAGFATVEESHVGQAVKKHNHEISDDDMTAQALIFFFAGFDSVSTLMCFMGYELAVNPDIQKRLQEEISEVLQNFDGKITYEAINQMKYLDMIISETLRKWPSNPGQDRICNTPFTIPAERPGEVDVHVEKGMSITIPAYAIHHDPEYYPKPEIFDPERFSDENKHNIDPYTYLPFGIGPRNCIGSRFALLETKAVFAHLLSKMNLVVIEKTQIPLKLNKKGFSLSPENGIWIELKPRRN